MKVISLNIQHGHIFDPLTDFITREASTTDVFCFQEVLSNPKEDLSVIPREGRANILEEIIRRLPDFNVWYAPTQDDEEIIPEYPQQMQCGVAMFSKKSLVVRDHGSFFILNGYNTYRDKDKGTLGYNAAYIQVGDRTSTTIICVYGNSQPGNKRDTPERLQQSQKIIDFARSRDGDKIVMGDFNLLPDTESVRMFEKAGFRNLIKEYDITTTRGTLLRRLHPEYGESPNGFQEFADYAFVTSGVGVKSFSVPDIPVSDHLPMILECE